MARSQNLVLAQNTCHGRRRYVRGRDDLPLEFWFFRRRIV
jgi:hypothetical protein